MAGNLLTSTQIFTQLCKGGGTPVLCMSVVCMSDMTQPWPCEVEPRAHFSLMPLPTTEQLHRVGAQEIKEGLWPGQDLTKL